MYCVYCIMIRYRHGVTIVRNMQSRVLRYVYVTCVTIIRNHMLEQLHCVYCVVAAVTVQLVSSVSLHPRVLHLVQSTRRSVLYTYLHVTFWILYAFFF